VGAAVLLALALPRHEASGVEMVFVQFGNFAVAPELRLKLHLIPPQCFATQRTRLTAPGTTHDSVRILRRQLSILDQFAGLLAESAIVHLFPDHPYTKSHPRR
jgi:hypothetical protein